MKDSVALKIQALTKQAKEQGSKVKTSSVSRGRSSLHRVIKTKEQAEAFMKLLQSA